ncbi:MAG: glycosyltransferase family 4 protein [Candidatus Methylomirabilis oxygeniifera]|uniref:Uncharacterized protein n=1 Tax=Methylomirabilis oxygeniifera TaxID=671143 RepID=D5MN28_METO1|nr:MAG: glycosyltransferase family 4 protein [Candidatus Methylomirabilis oxyfera]CBE68128.1 protein of unknown function [Candidatus Methylomirabilis oxyfera]
MRIMMVTGSLGGPSKPCGGAELHVLSLMQALSKRRHGIALLTGRSPNVPIQPPGVEAIFSTKTAFPILLTKLFQFDPVVYLSTLRIFRAWPPDIVHLHSFFNLSFAPIAAANRLRIPVLATLHTYWPVCLRQQLCYNEDGSCRQRYASEICAPCLARGLRDKMGVRLPVPFVNLVLRRAWRARRHLLQGVARFIAPSSTLARSLRESGFPTDRIVVIPHGLPQNNFALRPREPRFGQPGPHLLYVGRLVAGKGVQYLLEAIPQIRRAFPDLIITIAGDGPYRPALEQLCTSLGLMRITRFIGFRPRSHLAKLYAETDVIVIPSLSEVFSYVVLEAAAAGTPIVATTVGGIPEIVANGAVLVPPGDAAALAGGILAVLSDPTAAAARARLSQNRSLECFKFETMVDRAEAVYAELLNDGCFPIAPYPAVLAQPH